MERTSRPTADGWWILVADDEDLIRWSLREALQENGYRVVGAETGREALERFRDVDLVLVDYRLPDLDGLSVARAVKNARPSCPVILMTAFGTPELRDEVDTAHVEHLIDKPFDLRDVLRLVREALCPAGPR
ncbi:MAG TPA: response regulator [Vicinamibacteria bacterium]|nr:response regulator [Vicinamibacteria bacterium]